MKQRKMFGDSARRLLIVILILLEVSFLVCATGCGREIIVVKGESKIERIEEGDLAPYSGWLMTDRAFQDLYEAARWSLVEPPEKE